MAEWTLNGNKELEASLSLLSSPDEMYEDYKEVIARDEEER